ncbi:TonB-dependent receptor [Sphingomonas sinipercae]|uniref:TonB-dependent receptor n=1 Tax=Sphingomonas sinipercae TaxID=2714944 RepID=A0A6G7ZLA3_9SPHN|nr:TonB-dependent receptor [Sphingomonas sinipercae]QIL01699.1 TonB-dependent receptor [Sphingomonas sinipercae]
MRKSVWLLSAGLMALSTPAYAQEAQEGIQPQPDSAPETTSASSQTGSGGEQTTGQQEATSGDIVITANRRNEALSDVPIAVSAVTSESLENSGASDIRALTQLSPSLLVSSTSSEGGAAVARIRGVGTVGDNPGLESSVGVFIDGVYRSRTGTGLTELGAVDRIEVLRGPQGTLFGRNTSAGLISVITARPRFHTEAYGQLDIGNFDLRRVELGVTGPLSSTVAARLDGVYMQRDGFVRDVISGRDINDRDRWLLRGQVLVQPNDDVSFRLIADYAKRDEECCAAVYLPTFDVTAAGQQPSSLAAALTARGAIINDDPFARRVSVTPGRSYRSDVVDGGLSGELVYDFGAAELTSITAYRYNKYTRGQDADFNNLDILYRDDDGGAFNRFKTFSQELRLQGTSGPLDWLVGGYYANEKLRVRDNLAYGEDYQEFVNCRVASTPGGPLATFYDPNSTNCLNATTLNAAQAQLTAGITQLSTGIAQLTAAINQLQAIPNRTPQQEAQLQGALAQRAGLQATLATLIPQAQLVGAINFTPGNPGLGSVANALGIPGNGAFDVASNDLYDQTSNNLALFTHNIFSITPQLKLTVGARYTRERKKLDATLTGANPFCTAISQVPAFADVRPLVCVIPDLPGGQLTQSDSKTESKVSGTVVLSYKPTDQLLTYASYSRGYKAGGYNLDRASLPRFSKNGYVLPTATLNDLQFDPEINDAVEVGAKYNGRGFDVNVAVFQQLFDDFQLNLFNGISFEVETVNGCDNDLGGADTDYDSDTGTCTGKLKHGVRSRGVELEVFARPTRDLSLNFGTTYVNSRYSKNLVGSDAESATSRELFQLPGRRISNSAAWTSTGSITWTPPIGAGGLEGLVYLDARHSTTYNTGSDLDVEKTQKGYTVFNGRVGIHGPDNMWAIELWGRNLFDKNYIQVGFDAPLQGSGTTRAVDSGFIARSTQLFGAFLAEPRTFGMTLRTKFSGRRSAGPAYVAPPEAPAPVPQAQTCPDGTVIAADAMCPAAPVPPAPPAGERG